MAKGGYMGGGTVVTGSGFGFSALPEGGKKIGKSKPTENQLRAKANSDAIAKSIGLDQRSKKQKRLDKQRRKQDANRT